MKIGNSVYWYVYISVSAQVGGVKNGGIDSGIDAKCASENSEGFG